MTVSLRVTAVLAAVSLGACTNGAAPVSVASSRVDPSLQAIRSMGLLGTWAENCSLGPRTNNWFVTYYATPGGQVRRKSDRGPGEPTLDGTVEDATLLGPGRLQTRLRNDDPNWGSINGVSYLVVIEAQGGGHRSVSSLGDDGVYYIKDGLKRDGSPSVLLQRCR